MDAQQQKQEQLIRFLLEKWAADWCEQIVFEQFVRELKEKGIAGIPEHLHKIRDSPQVRGEYASMGTRVQAMVSAALGDMPLDQVEKLLQKQLPERGEPK